MATLYELEAQVKACINYGDGQVVDTDSGEILDLEAFEQLQLDRDAKREQVALYIKNKTADAAMLKEEAARLLNRAAACEREAKRCHDYLAAQLDGEKFETTRVKVTWRKSEAVEVYDVTKLPNKYLRTKVEIQPIKTDIKAALKAGDEVPGAELVTRRSMGVK